LISADTSVLIDFINGIENHHVKRLEEAIVAESLLLAPAVITELYGIKIKPDDRWNMLVQDAPLLEIYEGYWNRAGNLRRKLLLLKHKARLGDALIAQSCIDHDVPLLSRDADYKLYAKHGGLKLVKV
jgi:predicted nucleic acid-binding protein